MASQPAKKFNRTPPTIAAVVIALIVLAVGGYFVARKQEPPMPAQQEDMASDELQLPKEVEYALPLKRITGGSAQETIEPALEFPAVAATVTLNVERVFPLQTGASYTMFIRGTEIGFEVWIPPNYLEEGTVPLRLDGTVFAPGDYRIEIVETTVDSVKTPVAETAFRVVD